MSKIRKLIFHVEKKSMPDELKHLNKEDLFLLMESYRNMITMHSTLVEQQKQIIDLQNNIIKKQDIISIKQTQSCDQLKIITEKLGQCANNLLKTNDNINTSCTNLDKSINESISKVKEKVGENRLATQKGHSGINSRIYFAMGGTAAVIIALISLAIGLLDRYELIGAIHELVKQIAEHVIPHVH